MMFLFACNEYAILFLKVTPFENVRDKFHTLVIIRGWSTPFLDPNEAMSKTLHLTMSYIPKSAIDRTWWWTTLLTDV